MTGKITRASVDDYVRDRGYDPIQVDGIPEGFAFKEPDVEIGGMIHKGKLTVFFPLKKWEETCRAWCDSEEDLLKVYKEYNGK